MRNWGILREMSQMERDMNTVLRGLGLGCLPGSGIETVAALRSWLHINLREDADHIYAEALLPGVAPDRIDMNVLGNTLTITGERIAAEGENNGCTWHRREFGAEKFRRVIELPVDIDADQVKAEYRDGLLRVTLPKVRAVKPHKIAIAVQ